MLFRSGQSIFPQRFEQSSFTLVESETILPNVLVLTYRLAE